MRSTEPALRAIRSLVQFDVVQAAAVVKEAAERAAYASSRVMNLESRAESFVRELEQIMARPQLNAALLDAVRRAHRTEQSELHWWQGREAAAREREQQAHAALADLRNRERSLERALQAERGKRQLRIQRVDAIQADELWLQHSLRDFS